MLDEKDIAGLWKVTSFENVPCTDQTIHEAEAELGYKLPDSYKWLMKQQNGGYLERNVFPLDSKLPGLGNAAMMPQLFGIGHHVPITINGQMGTKFLVANWGFPEIGVAIGDGFFGCHEVFFLDYRHCGPQGEPKVSHVDQEAGYRITVLAGSFDDFIRGLIPDPDGF